MIELKSLLTPALIQQSLDRLPPVVNILMVLLLASILAQVTWSLVPSPAGEERIPVLPSTAKSPATSTPASRPSLSQLHLFGKAEQAPQVLEPVPEKMPETRLNLTLSGVLASTSTSVAKAIIGDSTGNENFYSVGTQVPGGATLHEIHEDHVILKRNNRLETLRLPKDMQSEGIVTEPTPAAQPTLPGSSESLSSGGSPGALLKTWKEKLDSDPQSLMSLVRAEPVRRNGNLIGYRIRPGKDRQLLRKFGLRSGDIVKEVNGMPLDNPLKGLEILNNLKTAGQVSLGIERNGAPQSFVFQVDQ